MAAGSKHVFAGDKTIRAAWFLLPPPFPLFPLRLNRLLSPSSILLPVCGQINNDMITWPACLARVGGLGRPPIWPYEPARKQASKAPPISWAPLWKRSQGGAFFPSSPTSCLPSSPWRMKRPLLITAMEKRGGWLLGGREEMGRRKIGNCASSRIWS